MYKKAVVAFHEDYAHYDLGEGHPFRGDRFGNARNFLEEQGLLKIPSITLVKPKPASEEDLLRVHKSSYVNLIFQLAENSRPYDIETPVSPEILKATLLIVGGALMCGDSVCRKEAKRGISLGGGYHHAGRSYGGGFCLFNDVAIVIEYLRDKYDLERFLILDYDVHFGNGTSDIYYQDPNVLYISIHQDPYTIYPGTGFASQIGEGEGKGFNVNVPLPPGTGDATYLFAFDEVFAPLSEEFKPDLIVANGGSDPHFADILGDLRLTVNGFFNLSSRIRKAADETCDGRMILMLGSGYNPEVLPLCWYALAAGVVGMKDIDIKDLYTPPGESSNCRGKVIKTIEDLKNLLRKHWRCFR
ncbi:hypothetical protein GTO27_08240 [Candidatus Bathyarchaeota archaeon]|nr:hypothetical protein [Candidatus Bathyarchaeota archaeon]